MDIWLEVEVTYLLTYLLVYLLYAYAYNLLDDHGTSLSISLG